MKTQSLLEIPQRVVRRHALLHHVSDEEAVQRSKELARFLFACSRSSEALVPSPIVDEIWHDFILDTIEYQRYCNKTFGRLVHHMPQEEVGNELQVRYGATLSFMQKRFGSLSREYWPEECALCDSSGCKGR